MEVYWTDFALLMLRGVHRFYASQAGRGVARRMVKELVLASGILSTYLESGPREPMLESRPQGFRYIVKRRHKIVYWINREAGRVEIVDVFDTRQKPDLLIKSH